MRPRLAAISVLCVLSALGSARSSAAATMFQVDANGMSAYLVDGVNNRTLTLTRGETYVWNVVTFGHPFWITTARGAGDTEANAFSQGVTDNGASPGTVTFVVPGSAPATLFYQCAFHDTMGGTLNIVGPATASVPSLGPGAGAALAVLLLLVAVSRRGQAAIAAMRASDQ